MEEKKCSTCALYNSQKNTCSCTQRPEQPDHYCDHWINEFKTCDLCGCSFAGLGTFTTDDAQNIILLCNECGHGLKKCVTCSHKTYCAFKEDKECTEPQVVNRPMRYGNTIVTQPTTNPERIKQTCGQKCRCWNDQDGCCRTCSGCNNYTLKERIT